MFPGLNPHIFTIYRFMVAIYFAGFTLWYFPYSVTNLGWKIFIYLTNWTFIVVTCYLLVASYNSLVHYRNVTRRGTILVSSSADIPDLPFIYKLQWFLYYLAANMSIIVTVVYWTALYSKGNLDFIHLFINLNVHTLTSFVAISETMLSATPFRFIHVVYPLCYGVVYVFFTIIYWVAGGTGKYGHSYIYPIIDYENDPGKAVLSIVGCIIGIFVFQVVLWVMFILRLKLAGKLLRTNNANERSADETTV
ncbi:protein rolling stone-like isoform X3 [Anneissia japonica]|uniref:protein rolling stone-like isoform X3 n=1 Tax=Anneissia japonica TaxID=1529436 RepID=UPI0014255710|nr:protein rolling stone-like isoform X3 [Anneissia japonica]